MKILIIHNKYGNFSGEESVVESQINLLKANNHEVITYFRSSEELELMSFGKAKAFFSGPYNPKSIKQITKLIKKEQPDLVHIHNLYPLISPAILPVIKKLGAPIVMTVHNYRLLCPNGLFFNDEKICEKCTGSGKEINCITNNCEDSLFKSSGYALRNFWARKKKYYIDNVDAFLCLTKFQKEKLTENNFPVDRCEVNPNFYNKEIEELNYDVENRKYVAFAGRISPEKGISVLLEAAQKLPHIPFKLAGEILEGYEEGLKMPKNVSMLGMLNTTELTNFYKKARFFISSSVCYEGFPMVFPEAMAHKLPIIAPKMAGYPEIVEENKNGLLFKPGNAESLANAIDKLWQNSELSKKFGEYGFEKTKLKYSSDSYYKELNKCYQKLLNK